MPPIPNSRPAGAVGYSLVEFALNGTFPEEDVSSIKISPPELALALTALQEAKEKLESEIQTINNETHHEVQTWFTNAQSLEFDVKLSRRMANDIEAEAQAPQVSGEAIYEAEQKVEFLAREMNFKEILRHTLENIRAVTELLEQAERKRDERRILESLRLLEDAKGVMDKVSVSRTCRAMKLLEVRIFELTDDVHAVFEKVWDKLVEVDREGHKITILEQRPDEHMRLQDACEGIISSGEVEKRVARLWHDLDKWIVRPRMDVEGVSSGEIKRIRVDQEWNTLSLEDTEDDYSTIALLEDVEGICKYLSKRLPEEFITRLSDVMMSDLSPRIIAEWLDPAVPSSLQDMDAFEAVVEKVNTLIGTLESCNFCHRGYKELEEWGRSAPKVWLTKCRETALDSVRSKLASGLGKTKEVERVETQKVTRSEGKELAAVGGGQENDGWDASWSDEEQAKPINPPVQEKAKEHQDIEMPAADEGVADAWGWGDEAADDSEREEERGAPKDVNPSPEKKSEEPKTLDDAGDEADAWGWGADGEEPEIQIEEPTPEPTTALSPKKPTITKQASSTSQPQPQTLQEPKPQQTREITLKENYLISSLPDPVLSLIASLLLDGRSLLSSNQPTREHNPSLVAPAAPGLFSLPTLILAMFRAISPHYYSLSPSGRMLLYNDSSYLATCLSTLSVEYKSDPELPARAKSLLKLENDVSTLNSFAARAYTNELSTQKTVLRDLLGGAQNMLLDPTPADANLDPAVAHMKNVGRIWKGVLAPSVWFQAMGSLVDEASRKFVRDVLDMSGIGQDDAFAIAGLIESLVLEVDGMFLPPRANVPSTTTAGASKDKGGKDHEREKSKASSVGGDEADAWGWGDDDDADQDLPGPGAEGQEEVADQDQDLMPTTAQFAPTWLRLKYLSQFLQSNLNEVRYMWFESELSLHFAAEEVIELIELSFEQNSRTKRVSREIRDRPHPLGVDGQGKGYF
ncbi:hypothetical protein MKZ38_008371 [Zalerion maritima]|uniref:ZW10 C-terminal helical domain-containing protein n=1 Tax=Zalerion maritima TaxID=339359 RepID=A0AAD5RUB7_9PEZI|nr:hypothetical protein MKZ38_008371 [Zalerion maritima]